MPKLPFKLPGSLGWAAGTSGLYIKSKGAVNYAIGGLPFLSAASAQNYLKFHPIERSTAPFKKDQLDTQQLPGEQSLTGYWLRSQMSFHGGAGQRFADPTQDNQSNEIRFWTSRNVDVWDPGRVTLLKNADQLAALPATPRDVTEFQYKDNTPAAVAVGSNSVMVILASTVSSSASPSATGLWSVTTDGSNIYVAALDGIWSAPIPATSGTAFTWTKLWTYSVTAHPFMAWAKSRIMLGIGPSVYELVPPGGGTPYALPTAKFTHLDTNWNWIGITETGTAIYTVGNNGVRGSINKFVLSTVGGVPTLSGGAAVAAQLPAGEYVTSALGYLSTYVAIGTNKGVRIAVADTNGDLSYGPILFNTSAAVGGWTARDRFLWCAASRGIDDGSGNLHSGLYRIDLSTQIDSLRFAYATDLVASGDTSDCLVVGNVGSTDQIFFATASNAYRSSLTAYAPTGFLQTSRIRFNTLEPKLYKLIRVRGAELQAPLAVVTLDQGDRVSGDFTFPTAKAPGENDVAIPSPVSPQDFISLRFVFTAADSPTFTKTAELWAYQLKALPATPRYRLIVLPLLCFDYEKGPFGVIQGGRGSALKRLLALEALEAKGDSVAFQDFDANTIASVVIENIKFNQFVPPPFAKGWGGVINITLRTVV